MTKKHTKYTMFSFGKASRGWIACAIAANIFIVAATIIFFDRICVIVDAVNSNGLSSNLINMSLILIAIALLGKIIFSWAANKSVHKISSKVKVGAREKLYSKILDLETGYRDVKKTGSITSSAVEGVEQLESIFGLVIPQVFLSLLIPFGLYFYVRQINSSIALTLLLLVIFIPISIMLVREWIKRLSKDHWYSYEDLHSYYLDSLQGITTLKTFGRIKQRTEEIGRKSENFRIRTMKILYSNLTSNLVMDILAMSGTAIGIILAMKALQAGTISIGSAIIIVLVAYEFFRPLRLLGSYTHIAMQGISACKSLLELLNTEPDRHAIARSQGHLKFGSNHDIRFEDVVFKYQDDRPPVLNKISFELKTGQITALVGESGCGKSTIANLINRFYEPNSGKITIGGIPLSEINPMEVRKNISMVSQRTYLFHGSIRENLLIANPDATSEELYEACRQAGIIDFVNSLPRKLDASLVEMAKNLSSGQIQRFSIARALLKNAPILILDEPTSNVDSDNEKKIQATLHEIAKTKTTLVIAHRLRTVREADKIITLGKGKVEETGTHDYLININGVYANLVKTQNQYEQAYA